MAGCRSARIAEQRLDSLFCYVGVHKSSAGKAGITCAVPDRKSYLRHGFRVPVSFP